MFHGHNARVLSVAFFPNGERIVSSSADDTIRVWDALSGEEILTMEGHKDAVHSIAVSHDGQWIVSGSHDCSIRLWNASSGSEVLPRPLQGHTDAVSSVAFSPDGTRIVSGSHDKTIRVWCASSGSQVAVLGGHKDLVTSVSFTPDGRRIVSGSKDETIRLWDSISGAEVLGPLLGHKWGIDSVAVSSDGQWIASCALDGTLRVWDANTGSESQVIRIETASLRSALFFPDSRCIATMSMTDNIVRIWDVTSGIQISSVTMHEGGCCMAISPSGDRFAIGFGRRTICVLNTTYHDYATSLEAEKYRITASFSHPNGERVASSSHQDQSVRPCDTELVAGGAMLLRGHVDFISCIAFSREGHFIASGSHDNTICVWDAATGAQTCVLRGHEDIVECVAFSPDGSHIASGSADRTVRLWSAPSGAQLLHTLRGHKKYLVSVAFSSDGGFVVSSCGGAKICVWNAILGTKVLQLRMPGALDIVTFRGEEKHLVLHILHHNKSTSTRGEILWDISRCCVITRKILPIDAAQVMMSPIVVHEDSWISNQVIGTIIGQLPSIVSVKIYTGSVTSESASIAFTSNDRWSTMFIIHFPSWEEQNDHSDSGLVCACGNRVPYDVPEAYDSDEDENEGYESDRHMSEEPFNERGPSIVRIKPGRENEKVCPVCRFRC
jgi:WD40 repeat protein